jgi:hypothetical protein
MLALKYTQQSIKIQKPFKISLFELDFKYGCIHFTIPSGSAEKRQFNFEKAFEKYILH